MESRLNRRDWLSTTTATAAALAGATVLSHSDRPARAATPGGDPFLYGLNTSTIRGQKLTIVQEAELAAKAGFRGLEPWIRELDEYTKGGGSLDDLRKRLADLGLGVESAIGFFDWVVDDEGRRKKALDEARRNMEMVKKIGGKRLAAPPSGATDRTDIDPRRIAERYRALLELGEQCGVVPQVEVWGFSKTLGTLAEATSAAIAADHPKACVLPDIFHLYKGGSGFQGLKLLSKESIHVFHLNDYPAKPDRKDITDADRVYPGDGVAPLKQVFRDLSANGFDGMLSIELFNKAYWQQDALTVLQTALGKLKRVVQESLG